MAITKKATKNNAGKDWQNGNPCVLLVELYMSAATMENNMVAPQKLKITLTNA